MNQYLKENRTTTFRAVRSEGAAAHTALFWARRVEEINHHPMAPAIASALGAVRDGAERRDLKWVHTGLLVSLSLTGEDALSGREVQVTASAAWTGRILGDDADTIEAHLSFDEAVELIMSVADQAIDIAQHRESPVQGLQ